MKFSKLTDPEGQACCSTDLYSAGLGKINEQRNISTKSVRILSSTGGKLGRNLVSCLSTWKSLGACPLSVNNGQRSESTKKLSYQIRLSWLCGKEITQRPTFMAISFHLITLTTSNLSLFFPQLLLHPSGSTFHAYASTC